MLKERCSLTTVEVVAMLGAEWQDVTFKIFGGGEDAFNFIIGHHASLSMRKSSESFASTHILQDFLSQDRRHTTIVPSPFQ